jgi:protein tyrosine phosphatase (PTP) superfamily phosphohydrolase (DUF442 family)
MEQMMDDKKKEEKQLKKLDKEISTKVATAWSLINEGMKLMDSTLEHRHPEFALFHSKVSLFLMSFYYITAVSRGDDTEKAVYYQQQLYAVIQQVVLTFCQNDPEFKKLIDGYMSHVMGISIDEINDQRMRVVQGSKTIH